MQLALGSLLRQMLEHVRARFIVHLGLEGEPVLQPDGSDCRGSCTDFVAKPLQAREFIPSAVAEYEGNHSRPSPCVHIDDGISAADEIAALGKPLVEDAVMAFRFVKVAPLSIGNALGGMVLEMNGLA